MSTVSVQPGAGKVDHTALKFNQASIILLLSLAYLLDWPWLVALVGAVMTVGTLWPGVGLFKLIYVHLLKPAGLLRPDPRTDRPHPHLFAQGLGAMVLVLATLALFSGGQFLGWLLAALVIVLAAVNLFAGFCLGCFLYYQLARRGVNLNLPLWGGVD